MKILFTNWKLFSSGQLKKKDFFFLFIHSSWTFCHCCCYYRMVNYVFFCLFVWKWIHTHTHTLEKQQSPKAFISGVRISCHSFHSFIHSKFDFDRPFLYIIWIESNLPPLWLKKKDNIIIHRWHSTKNVWHRQQNIYIGLFFTFFYLCEKK